MFPEFLETQLQNISIYPHGLFLSKKTYYLSMPSEGCLSPKLTPDVLWSTPKLAQELHQSRAGDRHHHLTIWEDQVFKDILGYIMSKKAAWATWNTTSQNQENKQKHQTRLTGRFCLSLTWFPTETAFICPSLWWALPSISCIYLKQQHRHASWRPKQEPYISTSQYRVSTLESPS